MTSDATGKSFNFGIQLILDPATAAGGQCAGTRNAKQNHYTAQMAMAMDVSRQ